MPKLAAPWVVEFPYADAAPRPGQPHRNQTMNRCITLTALALLCSASFSAGAGEATVLAVASTYQRYLMQTNEGSLP